MNSMIKNFFFLSNEIANSVLSRKYNFGAPGRNLRLRASADAFELFKFGTQNPEGFLVSPEGFEPPITVPKTVVISVSPQGHDVPPDDPIGRPVA